MEIKNSQGRNKGRIKRHSTEEKQLDLRGLVLPVLFKLSLNVLRDLLVLNVLLSLALPTEHVG